MDNRHANYQPWEKAFDRIVTPFEEFIHDETASGLILMACTLVALFLANGFLHEGMNLRHLIGVGLVGGIGFTMSIFIAELGFARQPESLLMAKTGVLFASILAGLAGYLWLRFVAGKS